MQHPEIPIIDRYDPYIDLKGFSKAISIYAADTNISNYMISPIYGVLEGLAPSIYSPGPTRWYCLMQEDW